VAAAKAAKLGGVGAFTGEGDGDGGLLLSL
jgi:hypothetical protein